MDWSYYIPTRLVSIGLLSGKRLGEGGTQTLANMHIIIQLVLEMDQFYNLHNYYGKDN